MSKKCFVSVPMHNRSKDDIKYTMDKMFNIAKEVFGDPDMEMMNTLFDFDTSTCNVPPLYYLGKALTELSFADYFIGPADCARYNGCKVELIEAKHYYIPTFQIDVENNYFMPDIYPPDTPF